MQQPPTAAEVYAVALAITSGLATPAEVERWAEIRRDPPEPGPLLCSRCGGALDDDVSTSAQVEPVPEVVEHVESEPVAAIQTSPAPLCGHGIPAPPGYRVAEHEPVA